MAHQLGESFVRGVSRLRRRTQWKNGGISGPGPRSLLAQRDARLSLRSTRAESENLRDIALDAGIAELILLPR